MSSKKKIRQKNQKQRKSKVILGNKIQQLCPVPSTGRKKAWQVLLLSFSEDGELYVDKDGDPVVDLEDVACWALVAEEVRGGKVQVVIPCVASVEGTVDPCDIHADNYVGVVPPSYSEDQILDMAQQFHEDADGKFKEVLYEDERTDEVEDVTE